MDTLVCQSHKQVFMSLLCDYNIFYDIFILLQLPHYNKNFLSLLMWRKPEETALFDSLYILLLHSLLGFSFLVCIQSFLQKSKNYYYCSFWQKFSRLPDYEAACHFCLLFVCKKCKQKNYQNIMSWRTELVSAVFRLVDRKIDKLQKKSIKTPIFKKYPLKRQKYTKTSITPLLGNSRWSNLYFCLVHLYCPPFLLLFTRISRKWNETTTCWFNRTEAWIRTTIELWVKKH